MDVSCPLTNNFQNNPYKTSFENNSHNQNIFQTILYNKKLFET